MVSSATIERIVRSVIARTGSRSTASRSASTTGRSSFQPVRRRPIALNLRERRLGTVQDPVRIVYVDRCVGESRTVKDARDKVAKIEQRLAEPPDSGIVR